MKTSRLTFQAYGLARVILAAPFQLTMFFPKISLRGLLCTALVLPLSAGAGDAVLPALPYPEVRYEHRALEAPSQQIWVTRIDLSDPDVEVRVAQGGLDPDGDGEYQTTLQPLSEIAARERFDVAVNGDFFFARAMADGEATRSRYVRDNWGGVRGHAATDGFVWSKGTETRPVLWFDAAKNPHIEAVADVPAGAHQVIAGSDILMRAGKILAQDKTKFSLTRHPRTAIGLMDRGKTLVLVVADGRDPARATGLSLDELARLMADLGCQEALNLDGGGSSEMVLRDPQSGQLRVINRPSDGRERAIANALGISIRGSRRVPGIVMPEVPAAKTEIK